MFFSFVGLLTSAIILMPTLIYALLPPKNKPILLKSTSKSLRFTENISRLLCIVLPAFSGFSFNRASINLWFWLMVISIALYYCLWIRYVFGNMHYNLLFKSLLNLPVPMAVFPSLAYLFASLWVRSPLILISAIVFTFSHIKSSIATASQLASLTSSTGTNTNNP